MLLGLFSQHFHEKGPSICSNLPPRPLYSFMPLGLGIGIILPQEALLYIYSITVICILQIL